MNKITCFYIISIIFILTGCSAAKESRNLVGNIRVEINEKYSITNGDVIAKFDLQGMSSDDKLYAPYYGKIVNSAILNRKFLNDFDGSYRYKDFLQVNSYKKMGELSKALYNISKKYKVMSGKTSKSVSRLAKYFEKHKELGENNKNDFHLQLSKLHDSTKFIPMLVPMYRPEVTSGFGVRENPFTKKKSRHYGLDLAAKINSEIYASADGVVEQVTTVRGYGNMIVIRHNNVLQSRYAHLSEFRVKQGDQVVMGQLIGLQGRTGTSSGHHLHFEVIVRNKPVDPMDFLGPSL